MGRLHWSVRSCSETAYQPEFDENYWKRLLALQSLLFGCTGRDTAFDAAYSTKRAPPVNYGIRIVPERTAFIIERFGKFNRVLESGIHLLIPLVHSIDYADYPAVLF